MNNYINIKLLDEDDFFVFTGLAKDVLRKLREIDESDYDDFFDRLHNLLAEHGVVNLNLSNKKCDLYNFSMYRFVPLSRTIGVIAYSDSINYKILCSICELLCSIKNTSIYFDVLDRKNDKKIYMIYVNDCHTVITTSLSWSEANP
jgi:hypothetical protein